MKIVIFAILIIPLLVYILWRKAQFIESWLRGEPKEKGKKMKDFTFYRRIFRRRKNDETD